MKVGLWIIIPTLIAYSLMYGVVFRLIKIDDFIVYLTTILLCFPFSVVLAEGLVFAFSKNKPWWHLK